MKNRTVPLSEIEAHYTGILRVVYPDRSFSPQEVHEIAISIIRILEYPNADRKRFNSSNLNDTIPREENFYLSLITFDLKTSAYDISDTGLDLMINTKELFSEAKTDLSLILVQYQLKNGYFDNVLQTVRELTEDVYKLRDEKKSVLEQLMYNGKDAHRTYFEFRDRVQSQLDKENTLFMAVNAYISQTIRDIEDSLKDDQVSKKYTDMSQYQVLLDIRTELESCINLYDLLPNNWN
ncbi:hypothetical protein EO93_01470 [Methanosarcina sp. 1.H.A.2.2]|nr:hypothetical protein EO93_01470 [Methanosarcina sp. 1.H.A.2.2]